MNNFIHKQNLSIDDKDLAYSILPHNEFDHPLTCSYYSSGDFVNAKVDKNFSTLPLNIHSIQRHLEELRVLLHALNFKFDINATSASKLKCDPQIGISLPGYHQPHCKFTEAEKRGTILYISKSLPLNPGMTWEYITAKNSSRVLSK